MRYFYNTEIEYMDPCKNGIFFVSIYDEEKTLRSANNYWGKPTRRNSYFMMDRLGRIYDMPIESTNNLLGSDYANLFNLKTRNGNVLVDNKQRIIAKDYIRLDSFTDDGYAIKTNQDNSQVLIDLTGEIFSDEFKAYTAFVNGLGVGQLDNGNWVYFDKNKNIVSVEFEEAHPFFNKDYSYVKKDGIKYIINRNFEVLSQAPERFLFISDEGIVYTLAGEKNKMYRFFDVYGNEIFKNVDIIFGSKNGIITCKTTDGKVEYYDMNKQKVIGTFLPGSEAFNENIAPVVVGENELGFLWTAMKEDGSTFKNSYGYVFQITDKLIAVYVDNSNGKTGRYYIVDENENPVTTKTFKYINPFRNGLAMYELSGKKYSYVDEKFKKLGETFDSASNFSEGYGVVKNNNVYDAITTSGEHLSEISKFAQKIDDDPAEFLNLPEKYINDESLYQSFYELALENIEKLKNDDSIATEINARLTELLKKIQSRYEENKQNLSVERSERNS